MRHKHHILPKRLGGTDDPSNIVELTIAEHADAHNLLYSIHKDPFDKLAELALLGMLSQEEIIQQKLSLAGKKSISTDKHKAAVRTVGESNAGRKASDVTKAKMSAVRKGVPKSEETKAKMRATALANRENRSRAAKIGNEKRWRK